MCDWPDIEKEVARDEAHMKQLALDDNLPYCVLHGWQWWPNDL